MPGPNSQVSVLDGTLDFSGGVNSIKVPTVQSERNRGGLARNELGWLVNGQVRDGGIRPRFGWTNLGSAMPLSSGRFQGAFLYKYFDTDPYFIMVIGGRVYAANPNNAGSYTDLSATFGETMPTTVNYVYFCQAEQFLVIQAGDGTTLPLFWDGTTLRRSLGLTTSLTLANALINASYVVPAVGDSVTVSTNVMYNGEIGDIVRYKSATQIFYDARVTAIGATSLTLLIISTTIPGATVIPGPTQPLYVLSDPELPAAGPMDYYMGRIWYAQGTIVVAGDIVRGVSGTAAYDFRDSVLKVTENPLAIGGDGFAMPGNDGNIRAVRHTANLDASLGQGRLYIFTRKAIYALTVPVTREDWINANYNNGPMLTVVQQSNGSVNDRSIVAVNGDLFFHSFEPGIRSLVVAVRTFAQWGNIEISANENRLLRGEDRALLYAASGVFYNNRLLQACLPTDTAYGVVWQAIAPLDFLPLSGYNEGTVSPVWEGMYQGLNLLQLAQADFGGLDRAFAIVGSDLDGKFQIWELSQASRSDNLNTRITWQLETPAFTWGDEATLKRLMAGEVWFDQISGTVDFTLEYRPDSDSCWHMWHVWQRCNIANTCEDPDVFLCYPPVAYPDSYQAMETLPQPRPVCANQNATARPTTIAYQFQFRLTVKGWCRIRGMWFHAGPFERSMFSRLSC